MFQFFAGNSNEIACFDEWLIIQYQLSNIFRLNSVIARRNRKVASTASSIQLAP